MEKNPATDEFVMPFSILLGNKYMVFYLFYPFFFLLEFVSYISELTNLIGPDGQP